MNDTNISFDRVKNDAIIIDSCADKMIKLFDQFITLMSKLDQADVLAGESTDLLFMKFDRLKNKIKECTGNVDNFSKMIMEAINENELLEKNIEKDLDSLPDISNL